MMSWLAGTQDHAHYGEASQSIVPSLGAVASICTLIVNLLLHGGSMVVAVALFAVGLIVWTAMDHWWHARWGRLRRLSHGALDDGTNLCGNLFEIMGRE